MIRNGGTTRSPMSRSRTRISIFRSGDRFASWFLRGYARWRHWGRNRRMRYMTILALVVAFAGPVHGASNDPKAARKGNEQDTTRQGAEKAPQAIANAQVYWLDTAYRRSDGALVQEQREFLRNKGDPRFLPPFSSLAECEAEAKYRINW